METLFNIVVTSLAMRLKGAGFAPKLLWKFMSAVAFGALFIGHGYEIAIYAAFAWLFGIVHGLPNIGELRNPVGRGIWIDCAKRGSINGALLSVLFMSPAPLLAGLTMPVWYWFGYKLEAHWPTIFVKGTHTAGYALGEFLFGAALGASIWLT